MDPQGCSASRFMELPVTIRLEIYRLLMGSHTLHWKDFRLSVCRARMSDQRYFAAKVASVPVAQAKQHRLDSRHHWCFASRKKSCALALNLHFLTTCRQIYLEACLVPFADNVFTFQRPVQMAEFLVRRLRHWQSRAIRAMTFYKVQSDVLTFKPMAYLSEHHLAALESVRRLSIYIEPAWSDFGPNPDSEQRAAKMDSAVAGLEKFLGLPKLTKVDVAVLHEFSSAASKPRPGAKPPTVEELEDWVARIKAILLPLKA